MRPGHVLFENFSPQKCNSLKPLRPFKFGTTTTRTKSKDQIILTRLNNMLLFKCCAYSINGALMCIPCRQGTEANTKCGDWQIAELNITRS